MLTPWWATELYPSKDEDNMGIAGDFEVYRVDEVRAAIAQARQKVWDRVVAYALMRSAISDQSRCCEVLAGNVVKEALENGALAELRGLDTWCREQAAKEAT